MDPLPVIGPTRHRPYLKVSLRGTGGRYSYPSGSYPAVVRGYPERQRWAGTGAAAERVLGSVADLSASFGTDVRVEGGRGYVGV